MISFLWAEDEKGVIGKNNRLPWHLPEDLKYFKKLTMGHPVVMGRRTFESIGRPLPGRTNVIMTRDPDFKAEGCVVVSGKAGLLKWADTHNSEIFVTGGAEIFALLLEEAGKLYRTKIYADIEGDTYFPPMNWDEWEMVSCTKGVKDENNPYDYEFQVFVRKP
ncbi:dihydrofolate reductase [Weizmannia acidilactici]|uniref:dihydrofolate reductase n=1 Tax=Weizmannia acidilactici TaxID=2607726 RepID=UPI00124E137A|nr:dihydrofolate reductase [Weizmannia acidilactici]GER65734.1 dihydrofolate reductase [Weizmannia acidilactici]